MANNSSSLASRLVSRVTYLLERIQTLTNENKQLEETVRVLDERCQRCDLEIKLLTEKLSVLSVVIENDPERQKLLQGFRTELSELLTELDECTELLHNRVDFGSDD